jgi:hypothetical protein
MPLLNYAAMATWRACRARVQWMDKTLVLTTGPDAIAFSLFKIFNFGQFVVLSDKVFVSHLSAVRALNHDSARASTLVSNFSTTRLRTACWRRGFTATPPLWSASIWALNGIKGERVTLSGHTRA